MKLALGVATGTTTSSISFATALFRQAFVTKDTFFPSLAVGNEAVKVPLALTQHIWTILCMNRLFPPDSLNTSDPPGDSRPSSKWVYLHSRVRRLPHSSEMHRGWLKMRGPRTTTP